MKKPLTPSVVGDMFLGLGPEATLTLAATPGHSGPLLLERPVPEDCSVTETWAEGETEQI